MDTKRLSYFIRVAEDGSLTRAAGILRIAQPALSRQIRLLEEELGVTLFKRTARGMQLTADGMLLRDSAAGPLRELEIALQNIRAPRTAAAVTLALGMPPNLTPLLAARLALAMGQQFPDIRFRLVEGPTGSLMDWLGRGVIDVALLEETARNHQLSERPITALPLALIGPAHSPLAQQQSIPLATALELPLVLPSHHLGIRGVINDEASRRQRRLTIVFEAEAASLTAELVAEGLGYGILPPCYLPREWWDGRLRLWALEPSPHIDILLASRKNSQLSSRQFGEVERAIIELSLDLLTQGGTGLPLQEAASYNERAGI